MVSNKFTQAIKRKGFTKVSYILSMLAFILATFAIGMVTTVLHSLEQSQKQRLLNYMPHVIVSYQHPLTQEHRVDYQQWQTFLTKLGANPNLAAQIKSVNLYAGGNFFAQTPRSLTTTFVVGVAPVHARYENKHWVTYLNDLPAPDPNFPLYTDNGNSENSGALTSSSPTQVKGISKTNGDSPSDLPNSSPSAFTNRATSSFISRELQYKLTYLTNFPANTPINSVGNNVGNNGDIRLLSSLMSIAPRAEDNSTPINSDSPSNSADASQEVYGDFGGRLDWLNYPKSLIEDPLRPGEFNLYLPNISAQRLQIGLGSEINLISSEQSIYLPTGEVPVSRKFTAVWNYPSLSSMNLFFANAFDIVRLNQEKELNQLVIFLKDPLEIDKFIPQFQKEFGMEKGELAYELVNPELAEYDPHLLVDEEDSDLTKDAEDKTNLTNYVPDSATDSATDSTVISETDSAVDSATATKLSTSLPTKLPGNTLWKVSDWRTELAVVFNSIKTEARVTSTLIWLLILIALISCLITFSFITVEKDRDIAVLNVLGMPAPNLNAVFQLIVFRLLVKANLYSAILVSIAIYFWEEYNLYLNVPVPLVVDAIKLVSIYVGATAVIMLTTWIAGRFLIKIRPGQILR